MRIVAFCAVAVVSCGLLVSCDGSRAEDGGKPKYTIKEVMLKAHKSGLMKKAVLGTATPDEKKELCDYYVEMAKNAPPKGDADSWKQKTEALIRAAREVQAGKPGAGPAFRKAVDCDNCHNVHKE
jgi:hypothetical protein